MRFHAKIPILFLATAFATKAFSLAITSKPFLIAFAKRAIDHPYVYQVTTDAGAETVVYSLAKAPQGMAISATGRITWVPSQSQTYDNAVSVKAAVGATEITQTFNVFVLGITKAARDALKSKNQAWVTRYSAVTTGTERPNYHMLMYIGDSQSMATNWGSAILGASTWHDGAFPHYPRFWGSYSSSEPVCQDVTNGNNGQSAMRSSGHSQEYGNLSSQQATFGMSVVRTAVTNTCTNGAATATVAFGHNDAAAGKNAATFAAQMSAICDSLLAFNIIPIVFTVSPGVAGGGWGSSTALALYPEYRDSVVAMCKRRNLPCIDVYSAVQSALNTGAAPSLTSMYNDAVHYKYDGDATTMNPLHNQAFALNIVNHMLAHMLGYMYESGMHAPVRDTYAASFYPLGLPMDPDRSPSYLTDYEGNATSRLGAPADPENRSQAKVSGSGMEIDFDLTGIRMGAKATVDIYDVSGHHVKRLFNGVIHDASNRLKLPWDGQAENGNTAPLGVYVARMKAGDKAYAQMLPPNSRGF